MRFDLDPKQKIGTMTRLAAHEGRAAVRGMLEISGEHRRSILVSTHDQRQCLHETEGRTDLERVRPVTEAIFIDVTVLAGRDIALDAKTDWFTPLVLQELSLLAPSLGSAIWLFLGWRQTVGDLGEARFPIVYGTSGLGGRAGAPT